jgi:hypothetical protein
MKSLAARPARTEIEDHDASARKVRSPCVTANEARNGVSRPKRRLCVFGRWVPLVGDRAQISYSGHRLSVFVMARVPEHKVSER